MKQVDREHYRFDHYVHFGRWASYYYQIKEILNISPEAILEIGVGDGVLKDYLKHNTAIKYTNVDVAEDLHPDVVGNLEMLPFSDKSFDMTVAFEVLEHIPYEKFKQCLMQLKRISKRHVIISVPHFGPPVYFRLKIPFIPELSFAFKVPFNKKHEFNGEHYWEIGKKDYPAMRIRRGIEKHFRILKEFVPFENQYHHFLY